MAVKFSIQKVPKIHLFQQKKQRHSFQNVLLTPTVAIATALSVNCPHLLRQSLTSLRLRLRLMTSKRCSSRDETLQPLVQTASPTLCGNVASASIGRYTLSSAEFGAQLTFLRLGSVLQSVYSINRAQRTIHPTSAQLPYQTAKAKCFSRLSARQSCGTCSGTCFLTSASRRGFCLT